MQISYIIILLSLILLYNNKAKLFKIWIKLIRLYLPFHAFSYSYMRILKQYFLCVIRIVPIWNREIFLSTKMCICSSFSLLIWLLLLLNKKNPSALQPTLLHNLQPLRYTVLRIPSLCMHKIAVAVTTHASLFTACTRPR